jgi:hypothetical protein
MDDPRKAVTSAEKAHGFSLEAEEPFWQVNADVLLGQAQVLLGDLGAASETLERALEIARLKGENTLDRINMYIMIYFQIMTKPLHSSAKISK